MTALAQARMHACVLHACMQGFRPALSIEGRRVSSDGGRRPDAVIAALQAQETSRQLRLPEHLSLRL
eukprot:681852-Pleurochrysis_carterae.AAC.3